MPATYTRYAGIIERELVPSTLGQMLLQKVKASHLEAYYADAALAPATLALHHAILKPALKKAKRDLLVKVNVALEAERPTDLRDKSADAQVHCWTVSEARAFLDAASARGPQSAAFYALALDSGARKGELCGLGWDALDLDGAKMSVVRQLLKPGPVPVFGPPKTGKPRTISLSPETVALLRVHRAHQAEVKMANRTSYRNHGLVFAKEWVNLGRGACLGQPLQMNNLGQHDYKAVIKAASVRWIKFHGLRHTCATLLLQARIPVHVVSERLGHATVKVTLEVYAHVLPNMQVEAAATLGALLHEGR